MKSGIKKEYYFVFSASVLSGTVVFGAKFLSEMNLSFYQIALFPLLFTLLFLPILLIPKYQIKQGHFKILILYGFISSIATFNEYIPVILGVPVALVVLLLYTQPIWTAIFGKVFLNEKISKYKILAIILVLIGVVILVNPFTINQIGSLKGVMIALLGGVTLSAWIIMGRVSSLNDIHPFSTQITYTFFIFIFLILYYPFFKQFASPEFTKISFGLPLVIWLAIIAYELLSRILPHILYFFGARKVESSDSGIIFLIEPVIAALLAAWFLQEAITLNIVTGGSFIVLANYINLKNK